MGGWAAGGAALQWKGPQRRYIGRPFTRAAAPTQRGLRISGMVSKVDADAPLAPGRGGNGALKEMRLADDEARWRSSPISTSPVGCC